MHKFALRLELDVISLQKLDVPDDDDDKIQTYKMLSICQYINIYIISFHNIRIYMGDPSTVKKTHNSALILPSNIFGESLWFLVNLVVVRTRTLWRSSRFFGWALYRQSQ